ncbi:DUF6243 family protein [Streptomyces beijiangensis]|uniref:Uncharacterized protein n=1 Tax=Streptomyces beijiangensis TaxID=163361 RepID=A0A939JL18_9ACTN|nr:DUF6243 family protein [Streptomyces beijiangensis]MBO0516422.1 hypothetical protein [Streptomyces beijiangensis]
MAKKNNLLGVGGQRTKMSQSSSQGQAGVSANDRRTAADAKQELARKMRERAGGTEVDAEAAEDTESTEQQG